MPPMRPYISSGGYSSATKQSKTRLFNLTQQTKTFKHVSQVPCPNSLLTDRILGSKMLFPLKVLINTSVIRSSLETFTIDQNYSLTLVCKYPKSHQVISTCRDLVIQTRQRTWSQNQSFKVALFFLRITRILPQFPSQFPFPHLPLGTDPEVGRLLPLLPPSGPLGHCRVQQPPLMGKLLVGPSLVLRTVNGSFRAFSHFPQ